jgi:Fungal protein kinase
MQNQDAMLADSMPDSLTLNAVLAFLLSISLTQASHFHELENCLVTTGVTDPSWADVHTIAALYNMSDSDGSKPGFQLLSDHAVEAFNDQPTRRFLRGFHLGLPSGAVEFWAFDRGGSYMLESFNIRDERGRFAQAMVDLLRLGREAVGMDTAILKDERGPYIVLDERSTALQDRIYVEETYKILGVMARGTVVCFRGRVGLSHEWTLAIKFFWRPEIDRSEEDLLSMLEQKKVWGVPRLRGHRDIDSLSKIRKSLGYETARDPVENKVFACIAISPFGRRLWDFSTPIGMLVAIRDAVKAHKSLLQQGGLLHQDISPYNIIMVSGLHPDDPRGMLIDLDLAMDVAVGPRHEGEICGTKPFMAIGVLKRKVHTYRHDLESFLYVLLWLVVSDTKRMPPTTSKLHGWMKGSFPEVEETKMRHLKASGFREILSEFPPRFQDVKVLAEELHEVLFPFVEGSLFTGTDVSEEGVEKLYGGVIGAFDKAILASIESTVPSL